MRNNQLPSFQVSIHQRSALSPLLFIMVMDVLTEDVRNGSLMELLYADDLVLRGESFNAVMDKYGRWKNAVEGKSLRVNVNKKKYTIIIWEEKHCFESGSLWCLWCAVGCNSILCSKLYVRNARDAFIVAFLIYLGR